MRSVIARSLSRLFLVLSIFILIGFIVSFMPQRVESQRIVFQENAATSIATVCESLLEGCARNPSLCNLSTTGGNTIVLDLYNEAIDDIMALNLESFPTDIALAKGTIKAALITAVARNPSLQTQLFLIEAICNDDIEAL